MTLFSSSAEYIFNPHVMIPNFHLKQQVLQIKITPPGQEALFFRIDSMIYNEFILVTVWNFLLTQESQNRSA